MYLLSLFATLFLLSAALSTAAERCPVGEVYCNCSQPLFPRCSLKDLSELKSANLSNYLKKNGVHYLSFTFSDNRTFPSGALPSHDFTELVIDGRNLTAVDDNAFAGLENTLRTLRLRYGRFDRIPVPAIRKLGVLCHLDMEGNQIRRLDQSLRKLNFSGLNLNQNKINRLERDILPLTLEDLGLKKNNLFLLNRALSGNIKDLDLAENKIVSLDGELNNLPELVMLKASGNQIERIDLKTFAKLNKLRTLYLSNNMIHTLYDSGSSSLPNLGYLDLSVNKLKYVSKRVFDNLEGLVTLNISSNQLESLSEGTMDGLKSLVQLDISSNKLSHLKFLPTSFGAWKDDKQRVLRMKDSGIRCNYENIQIILKLRINGVYVDGNPC